MAQTYKIQQGDTLSGIASRHGTTYQELARINNIKNPNMIYAGTSIKLTGAKQGDAGQVNRQPRRKEDVAQYLKDVQRDQLAIEREQTYRTGDIIPKDLQNQKDQALDNLENMGEAPEAPSLKETYSDLREEYGVQTLEQDLNMLKSQADEVQATMRARSQNERQQRVGAGVIAGRLSEVERQGREDLDFINRQIRTRTDQIESAYNVINTMMSLESQDYENALRSYNAKFNRNLKMYEIMRNEYRDERDFNQRLKEREEDTAKANLQIYADMISSGAMSYDDFGREQKLAIAKLEIQSGLGKGFLQNVEIPMSKRIQQIGVNTNPNGDKYAQMLIMGDNGEMELKSVYLGKDGAFLAQQQARYASERSRQLEAEVEAMRDQRRVDAERKKKDFEEQKEYQQIVRDNPKAWSQVFETIKRKYGFTNDETDRYLGVPDHVIADEDVPGWKWAEESFGSY